MKTIAKILAAIVLLPAVLYLVAAGGQYLVGKTSCNGLIECGKIVFASTAPAASPPVARPAAPPPVAAPAAPPPAATPASPAGCRIVKVHTPPFDVNLNMTVQHATDTSFLTTFKACEASAVAGKNGQESVVRVAADSRGLMFLQLPATDVRLQFMFGPADSAVRYRGKKFQVVVPASAVEATLAEVP